LTCSLGETALALISDQVTRVRRWGASEGVVRRPLAEALGLPVQVACARELLCGARGAEVAFGIPTSLVQQKAVPGSIVAPSQVLKRLRAPAWLAGFFISPASSGGGLALIVDLTLLSTAAPLPQDPAR
jgi:hypothetical protein